MRIRRPAPHIACRAPGVVRHPSSVHFAARRERRAGMTLIELGAVMGIVTVLMALVLGLSRHVNEVVKIRRAQADLGEWHDALHRWHLMHGVYPDAPVDLTQPGGPTPPSLMNAANPASNLSNVLANTYVRFEEDGRDAQIYFRSLVHPEMRQLDPWNFPYLYICGPEQQSYLLFSSGPNSRTVIHGRPIPARASLTPDPTLDDIYFER